jgi:hypothetical protein
MTISYSKAEMMAHDLLTSMSPARRAALRKMMGEPEPARPELRIVEPQTEEQPS